MATKKRPNASDAIPPRSPRANNQTPIPTKNSARTIRAYARRRAAPASWVRGVSRTQLRRVDETLIVRRVQDACLGLVAPAAPASHKRSFLRRTGLHATSNSQARARGVRFARRPRGQGMSRTSWARDTRLSWLLPLLGDSTRRKRLELGQAPLAVNFGGRKR